RGRGEPHEGGARHPAKAMVEEREDAGDDLVRGFRGVHGQVGERGMALGDFAGAQAVDGAGGNAEWPETPRYRGVARVRFQADQAQRQGGADFGGAERSEWGDGVDRSAQIARY